MAFRDTRFLVTLLSEDIKSYYTTRVLQLQNISVGQSFYLKQGAFPVQGVNGELKWLKGVTPRRITRTCVEASANLKHPSSSPSFLFLQTD